MPSYVHHERLPIKQLANGDFLYWNKWTFEGSQSETHPSVYIQASLHGSELQGNLVLVHLMDYLMKHRPLGTITCIPVVNPFGTSHKQGEYTQGRYDPITGVNWNRAFWLCTKEGGKKGGKEREGSEGKQGEELDLYQWYNDHGRFYSNAIEFKNAFKDRLKKTIQHKIHKMECEYRLEYPEYLSLKILEQSITADIVLDLHTGPHSTTYMYSFSDRLEEALWFHFNPIISIPHLFAGAMDEATHIPWSMLKEVIQREKEKEKEKEKEGGSGEIKKEKEKKKEEKQENNKHKSTQKNDFDWYDHSSFTLEFGSQEIMNEKYAKNDTERLLNYLKNKHVITDFKSKFNPESSNASHASHGSKQPHPSKNIFSLSDYHPLFSPLGGLISFTQKPGEVINKGLPIATIYQFHQCPFSHTIIAPCDLLLVNHTPNGVIHQGQELGRYLKL
jgi:predicted deacylase